MIELYSHIRFLGHRRSIWVAKTWDRRLSFGCTWCLSQIRGFIQKFYTFIEGVSQHHRNIDELLSKVSFTRVCHFCQLTIFLQSLDNLLTDHISKAIGRRLAGTSTLTQIAQIVTNLEHFQVACTELERSLTNLRSVIIWLSGGFLESVLFADPRNEVVPSDSAQLRHLKQHYLVPLNGSLASSLPNLINFSNFPSISGLLKPGMMLPACTFMSWSTG